VKRILLTIGVLFTSQSFAAEPVFCSSPTMAYQSDCTSTCAAVAAAVAAGDVVINNGAGGIPTNSYKFCEGKVTKKTVKVYKIEMGKTTIGDESRCTIWEGDDLTVELGGSSIETLSSRYPITLKSCTIGTEYNAFYLTADRYEQFAAESVFPDATGKVARTTSTYAAKDTGHGNTLSVWRDEKFADASKFYTTPGWATAAYKKLGDEASDIDLINESNVTMEWDELKTSNSWGTDTTTRPGFMCESDDSNDCSAEADGRTDRYISIIPTASITGLPLTLKEGDETFDLEYVRFASERGTNKYKGVEFLWYNDDGTLKYAGAATTPNGGYLVVTNVRSNEGL
jgi:hypothetical protein